ncbi:activating molecule in BECN1-regulated autophagy protein, partial [Trifolium medium]|nr:activating molecule in BECN1-regulated autophagy protein [Trifolium medium]
MTEATSIGYLQYPPPSFFVTNVQPAEHVTSSSESPNVSLPFFFVPSYTVDESREELPHASHDVGSGRIQIESSAVVQFQTNTNATEQYDATVSPMDTVSEMTTNSPAHTTFSNGMGVGIRNLTVDGMETDETRPAEGSQHRN